MMNKIFYTLLMVLVLTNKGIAEQKFNPMTGKYETTTKDSRIQYNYMENEWKYAPPNSKIEYNPLTNKYDMAPKEYINKYKHCHKPLQQWTAAVWN